MAPETVSSDSARKIEDIAKPFVEFGVYDSEEKFLKDVVREIIRSKTRTYKETIKKFNDKYKMTFSEFTKKIENRATIKQENEWMEWESTINMLKAWKKAAKEIGISAA